MVIGKIFCCGFVVLNMMHKFIEIIILLQVENAANNAIRLLACIEQLRNFTSTLYRRLTNITRSRKALVHISHGYPCKLVHVQYTVQPYIGQLV